MVDCGSLDPKFKLNGYVYFSKNSCHGIASRAVKSFAIDGKLAT